MKPGIFAAAAAGIIIMGAASCGSSPELSSRIVENTVVIGEVGTVEIDLTSSRLTVRQGDRNEVHYRVSEDIEPEITESGGKLSVRCDTSRSFSYSGSDADNCVEVTLTCPQLEDIRIELSSGDAVIKDLDISGSIKTTSGSISVSNSVSGKDIKLRASSGGIGLKDCRFGKIAEETASGSALLENVTAQRTELSAGSGGISIMGSELGETVLKSSSGNIEAADSRFGTLRKENSSGNTVFEDITADSLELDATSGDTKLKLAALCSADISGSSGNVEIELPCKPGDCDLDLSLSSGDLTVDGTEYEKEYKSDTGKGAVVKCRLSSGDIEVSFR